MNKKIIVLNGAARKNGNTAKLVNAFADGAKSVGNQVKSFYLDGMNIHSCKGLLTCWQGFQKPMQSKGRYGTNLCRI